MNVTADEVGHIGEALIRLLQAPNMLDTESSEV